MQNPFASMHGSSGPRPPWASAPWGEPIEIPHRSGLLQLDTVSARGDRSSPAPPLLRAAVAALDRTPQPDGLCALFGSIADPRDPKLMIAGLLIVGPLERGVGLLGVLSAVGADAPATSFEELFNANTGPFELRVVNQVAARRLRAIGRRSETLRPGPVALREAADEFEQHGALRARF